MFRTSTVLAFILFIAPTPVFAQYLSIFHINVGQGDSTLIIAPDGKTLLMDGGDVGKGSTDVGALLHNLGIDTLDYVVASHYDSDHIGGLDEVFSLLRDIPASTLDHGTMGPLPLPTTKQYAQYAGFLPKNRAPVLLGVGAIDLGNDVKVLVAAANGCVFRTQLTPVEKGLDENAASVALVINYGTFDYYVGGDLTGGGRTGSRVTQDMESLAAPVIGDVDVVRLNHHGSGTSSNETFLHTLRPEVAVISVGNGGRNRASFHHPRRIVLDRLDALASDQILKQIFMTNKGETDGGLTDKDRSHMTIADGDVTIFASKQSYTVNGKTYPTDGKVSGAADFAAAGTQECNTHDP